MSEIAVRRQVVSERRQVLREIAKEKAGKEDKYLEEDKGQRQETKEGMPFEQISPEKIILERRREDDSAFNWTQFAPFKREKEKARPLNTATIWLMARKEIAQVWRDAKGVKKRNPRIDGLEREAAMYGQKQEDEKLRQEKARAEFEKQKANVNEVLKIVGQKILEEKDNRTAEKAASLFEDAFGATGKVYDVQWREDGCDIWIEPWEKRWSRQNRELPTIYKIGINDELGMVSYDLVEDEEARQKVNEEMLASRLNQLDESGGEEFLGVDEEYIKAGIEKKIEKVGRITELKRLKENVWLATVELWDQMRIRNVERKGEGPIVTESILAKVVDGTIVTSHVQGKKSWEKKEESESESGTAQQKEGEKG